MVKVLDPEGIIIGVFESADDVPKKLWNRMSTFRYPTSECKIVEVTDPADYQRLLPSLRKRKKRKPY